MTASQPPAPTRSLWRRLTTAYGALLTHLLVVMVAILVVPVSLQVFSRYLAFVPTYDWTEEMARFLFVWLIMIGAMIGVRDSAHFDVDIWPDLSPRAEALLRIISRIGILVFSLAFAWAGIEFTQFAWHRISELAELPLWLIHIAWPIAGFTWIAFLGEQFVDNVKIVLRSDAP